MPETYLLCRISQILYSLKAEQGADSGSSIPHAKGRYHATSLQRTSGANVRKFWACIKSSRYWLFQNMYLIFVYPQFSLNICKFYLNMQYAQIIDPVAPPAQCCIVAIFARSCYHIINANIRTTLTQLKKLMLKNNKSMQQLTQHTHVPRRPCDFFDPWPTSTSCSILSLDALGEI